MQSSITVQNGTGVEVRASINNALKSLATEFAGATDVSTMSPSNALAFSKWLDTNNGLVKRRNAANTGWNSEGTINASGKVMLYNVYGQSGAKNITANTTLTNDDSNMLIVVDSASAVTLTMPSPTAYMSFKIFNKGTGTVTITNGTFYASSGAVTSLTLATNESVNLSSDGTSFYSV